MGITVLETERLVLEIIDESHFEDLFALLSNERVHRYFPSVPNAEESMTFFKNVKRRYADDGYGLWAVMRKSDGKFTGICGLVKQIIAEREETEVGYRFSDLYWGHGYGTEAARGCMEYARNRLGKKSVISLIREINTPSIRVAENNGMKYEKDVVFYGLTHRLYRFEFRV